jgi:CheY-like chemotaxis protein
VEDTGSGIAPEDLETIFQPFEQVGPMKQRAGGAGLGLAISRRIVQMMGSDIRVHSAPGAGSRFWFDLRLPLARSGAAASSEGSRRISGYEGPRRTALVVDDVAANRDIVCSVLGMAGFAALEARDGLEALELLSAGSADLVVLDMHMPGLDGPQVLRAIRNDSRLSSLPVIAVSASNFPADLEQALAAGADAFLPKPLDFNRLFDLVAERLKLKWITAPQTQAMLAAQSAAAA